MPPVQLPPSIWQALANTRPLLPMYAHLIVSSLFPIYTGAHASLSRPSSAAKSKKKANKDEDDEDESIQKMEGLSPKDAVIFPITAGLVLMSLYWLIKKYGADLINLILGWYFSAVGVYSVGKLVNDATMVVLSFMFPTFYSDCGSLWTLDSTARTVKSDRSLVNGHPRSSPLPAFLGRIRLPRIVAGGLWRLRSLSTQKFAFQAYVKGILEVKAKLTVLNIFSAVCGIAAIAYANLIAKPWWLTNIQGFAVCYSALQFMSPTTFGTGSLILAGLFFYDIWAVFFTPFMVGVAKNLDQPIKLVFPRPDEFDHKGEKLAKAYSMLGLGDIVLPGIMIGLALRYDLYMHYANKQSRARKLPKDGKAEGDIVQQVPYVPVTGRWGDCFWTSRSNQPSQLSAAYFPQPYFTASMVGYVVGMLTTLGVMSVWQHAQPALLYLVPGVLLSLWGTALVRGEIKAMWNFSEAVTGDALVQDKQKAKEHQAKDKKDERSWKQYLWDELFGSSVEDRQKALDVGSSEKKATDEEAAQSAEKDFDIILSFSVKRHPPAISSNNLINKTKRSSEIHSNERSDSGSEGTRFVLTDVGGIAENGPARRTRSAQAKNAGNGS